MSLPRHGPSGASDVLAEEVAERGEELRAPCRGMRILKRGLATSHQMTQTAAVAVDPTAAPAQA